MKRFLVAVLVIGTCACSSPPPPLTGGGGKTGGLVGISQIEDVGFVFENSGSQTVHLLDARLTGVPANVEVVGIYAIDFCEGGLAGALGATIGDLNKVGLHPHPVTAFVLKPNGGSWYLVASVRGRAIGTFDTRGIRLTYTAGHKRYTQEFPGVIEITVRSRPLPEAHPGVRVPGRRALPTTPPPACSKQ